MATSDAGLGREEVLSVSASSGSLVAIGSESAVLVWDIRASTQSCLRWEVHTEPITSVRFQPGSATTLLSGSQDGLICAFDCSQKDEDAAIATILNTESPIASVDFFGPCPSAQVYVQSSNETFTVWDLQKNSCLARFDSIIRQVSDGDDESPMADGIDYILGCACDDISSRLYLVAGEHSGSLHILAVESNELVVMSTLQGGTTSGHAADVRCFDWTSDCLITGGEDARLCVWSGAEEMDVSSASRSLKVTRRKERRATPY